MIKGGETIFKSSLRQENQSKETGGWFEYLE